MARLFAAMLFIMTNGSLLWHFLLWRGSFVTAIFIMAGLFVVTMTTIGKWLFAVVLLLMARWVLGVCLYASSPFYALKAFFIRSETVFV